MYLPVLWTLFVCVSRLIFFSIYCSVYRFFLLFLSVFCLFFFFFFQAEDGIRDKLVTGVQTCALPISLRDVLGALARADDDDTARLLAEVRRDVVQLRRAGLARDALHDRARRPHQTLLRQPLVVEEWDDDDIDFGELARTRGAEPHVPSRRTARASFSRAAAGSGTRIRSSPARRVMPRSSRKPRSGSTCLRLEPVRSRARDTVIAGERASSSTTASPKRSTASGRNAPSAPTRTTSPRSASAASSSRSIPYSVSSVAVDGGCSGSAASADRALVQRSSCSGARRTVCPGRASRLARTSTRPSATSRSSRAAQRFGGSPTAARISSRGAPARSGALRCAFASVRSTRIARASTAPRDRNASASGTTAPDPTSSASAASRSAAPMPARSADRKSVV